MKNYPKVQDLGLDVVAMNRQIPQLWLISSSRGPTYDYPSGDPGFPSESLAASHRLELEIRRPDPRHLDMPDSPAISGNQVRPKLSLERKINILVPQ